MIPIVNKRFANDVLDVSKCEEEPYAQIQNGLRVTQIRNCPPAMKYWIILQGIGNSTKESRSEDCCPSEDKSAPRRNDWTDLMPFNGEGESLHETGDQSLVVLSLAVTLEEQRDGAGADATDAIIRIINEKSFILDSFKDNVKFINTVKKEHQDIIER